MSRVLLHIYTGIFLLFLFSPMLVMMVASFNDTSPPSAFNWQGFTIKWYSFFWESKEALFQDNVMKSIDRDRFIRCALTSLHIAVYVVPLSILLGLSGAILVTRLRTKLTSFLWWVFLSPILLPGVVVGLSTLVFWKAVGVNAGIFTIVLAHSSFIAGYCMLILISRLDKFPIEQERAAFSLGATPWQTFWRVTFPFLLPSMLSSAVIATLASVENYNTTMFVKGASCTFATEIGAMTKNVYGHPPVINALGTSIVIITLIFAILHTFAKKSEGRHGKASNVFRRS